MVFVPHRLLISLSIMLSSSIHAIAKGISSFVVSHGIRWGLGQSGHTMTMGRQGYCFPYILKPE